MSKIVYGSVERQIVSSDLIEERAKKNFKASLDEIFDSDNYRRALEGRAFMESYPELANSHKFYDMTR